MRELHVIVKEEDLRKLTVWGGNMAEHAQQVLREISRIKLEKEYLQINGSSSELHPRMPKPSPDLIVFVSGGLRNMACTLQLYNLRLKGYTAFFHPAACVETGSALTAAYSFPHFKELVPEYSGSSTN
jgi:hypothetical protein